MALPPHDVLHNAMQQACAKARTWMGATSPNPPVGAAALDAEGRILAVAAHRRAGEAHAEAAVLDVCKKNGLLARAATLCVTLEPCNHHGLTPPCTEAIIASGIRQVAIGARDPNPHVQGGGMQRLQAAGIDVAAGIAEEECRQLIHAFAYSVRNDRPWVTVKRAFDAAGSMIPPQGRKTFTSPEQLRLAHRLRKKSDAILTGSGTILADQPLFTVRHVRDHVGKRRWLAILDRRGRVPKDYLAAVAQCGFRVLRHGDIGEALADLAAKGAQDVLIEAGPAVSQSLLDSGLWSMSVTLRKSGADAPDTNEVDFNPQIRLPFDAQQFRWDCILPQE